MSMTLYVFAKSKKAINERLANGERITGDNYSIFGGGGTYPLDASLAEGTVIKVYEKMVGDCPYAKAYGTWKGGKVK